MMIMVIQLSGPLFSKAVTTAKREFMEIWCDGQAQPPDAKSQSALTMQHVRSQTFMVISKWVARGSTLSQEAPSSCRPYRYV